MIHHVQIACPPGAEARLRAFYTGVLGRAEPQTPAAHSPRRLLVPGPRVGGPDGEFHVGVEDPFHPARKAHPAFVVDVDATADAVTAAGYEVRWADPPEIPGRRRFHTTDPVGNRLEFLAG